MTPDVPARVVLNDGFGAGIHRLRLYAPEVAATVAAGQFVMLGCAEAGGPLLRRPFSIQKTDGEQFDVLYRVVGVGTRALAALRPGQVVPVLGPLGRGFTPPQPSEHAILIGGGVGVPPIFLMAAQLDSRGHRAWSAVLGVRGRADRPCLVAFDEGFPGDGRVHLCTIDGSFGHRGHVVSLWESLGPVPARARVYACGPMAMLRAVAEAAALRGLPCEVSVETMMGCGVGICMGCVMESSAYVNAGGEERKSFSPYDRWWLACRRGPVFDAQAVVLNDGGLLH